MHADWVTLMGTYANTDGVLIASSQCDGTGSSLCDHYNTGFYPHIVYGDPASPQEYNGERDYNTLLAFAEKNLGHEAVAFVQKHLAPGAKSGGPADWAKVCPKSSDVVV